MVGVKKSRLPPRARNVFSRTLVRVAEATATLCLDPDEESASVFEEASAEVLLQRISRQLLRACHPHLIGLPIPQPLVELEEREKRPLELNLLDEDDESRIPDWKKNRTDYLRCVLRALPPIALDVAAHVCSVMASSDGSIPKDTAASAFILFSNWLPIAPQLAPLVSDMFQLDQFPCPLDYGVSEQDVQNTDMTSDDVQLLLAEAAHAVYEFYAKRGEHSIMTRWWIWGHLFTMMLQRTETVDMWS